ncbi:ATP-binding protein [Alisedimentitalea sp. MJ-SS2]|uniref:ATP-binding protein n=1 Tax=Aliisedimentitalea sp. MJ-SS2 TaxID=3049795 RepID=UPI00290AB41F|nr:ATP-binding protein [Alisedimentitalea sp. MJ-SS2]MDU8929917.1 ATP-binding protein [Alisedimentitalea sp. MJ-SS2]
MKFDGGKKRDGGTLRSDLAQIRKKSQPRQEHSEILQMASVLSHFDLFDLAQVLERHAGQAEAEEATWQLMEEADHLTSPANAWTLPLSLRQTVLAGFDDRAQVLAILDRFDELPDTPVQPVFVAAMTDPLQLAETYRSLDPAALSGLLEVLSWLDRAEHLRCDLPDSVEVSKSLANARRLEPLKRLAGTHFEGRRAVLDQMQDYLISDESQDMLFLYGPGGIGKSTVLAKFALDAVESGDVEAIVYLNLDRPLLRPEEPLSLLADFLGQLGHQFPDFQGPLEKTGSLVNDLQRRLSYAAPSKTLLESSASTSEDWYWVVDEVAGVLEGLPGSGRILVMIDTFEQAQRRGRHVISELWRMAVHLSERVPRLRIIAAGRLEDDVHSQNQIALQAFELSDVERVFARAVGEDIPQALVDDIYEVTGGHPLTVQLAATYVGRVGVQTFDNPETRKQTLAKLSEKKRDAILYGRILEQIGDEQVQKLAIPGLVMRRITTAVIEHVLAKPCGLSLTTEDAQTLFDKMAIEVDLVKKDFSDPDASALVHRADVRALMLADLRKDRAQQARKIDKRAVKHFADQPGPYARAEEIYHRIWLGQDDKTLGARWMDEAAPLLVSALDDLPDDRKAWLGRRLGVGLESEVTQILPQDEWERVTAEEARQLLARGDADSALALLGERTDRNPDSELHLIEAEALLVSGRRQEGYEILDRAVAGSEDSGREGVLLERLLLRSHNLESERRFAEASRDAARALNIAKELENDEYQMRASAGLLRLNRKSRSSAGPNKDELMSRLNGLIIMDPAKSGTQPLPDVLYENPQLARELAAEIGADYPELLELSARQTGSVIKPRKDEVGSAFVAEVVNQMAELDDAGVGSLIEKIVGGEDEDVVQNLSDLVSVARDRKVLDKMSKPLSWLLSAEVDRQIGAFPSKSMIARHTNVKIADG